MNLTLCLKDELDASLEEATEIVHLLKMAVYFLPLLGGWLASQWLGRYRTILSLAVFYCLGNVARAFFGCGREGVYAGLALIALGAGGIKPCAGVCQRSV